MHSVSSLMPRLQKLALKSNLLFKMSAIVFTDRWILGTGYNYMMPVISNKRLINGNRSIHAEMAALSQALHKHGDRIVAGASIVVYRYNQQGMANSKPCNECRKLLERYGMTVEYVQDGEWKSD